MAYATQLFFDPTCETRVRRLCTMLREAGINGSVLTEDVKARPHITLHISERVDEDRMRQACRRTASQFSAMPVSFASLGIFPGALSVVFLAPVITEDLLQMHRYVHAEEREWASGSWNLYTPPRWVPHCTLVNRADKDSVKDIVETVSEISFPISGELVELGVAEFREGRVVRNMFSFALQ
jgi:2'-5' RNA ligase